MTSSPKDISRVIKVSGILADCEAVPLANYRGGMLFRLPRSPVNTVDYYCSWDAEGPFYLAHDHAGNMARHVFPDHPDDPAEGTAHHMMPLVNTCKFVKFLANTSGVIRIIVKE